MKKAIGILVVLMLSACNDPGISYSPTIEASLKMERGLSDCKSYLVNAKNGNIVVIRCPNSSTSTSYQEGKTQRSVITIDGIEYTQH